jgi:hypothetical protein
MSLRSIRATQLSLGSKLVNTRKFIAAAVLAAAIHLSPASA